MTRAEILARYPNASKSFIEANLDAHTKIERILADHPKPDQGSALDGSQPGKETCWYGAAKRFEITFHCWSLRPCDWDGWDVKALQDMVVVAQIIPNDSWNLLSGRIISRKVQKAEEERTEIEIVAYD